MSKREAIRMSEEEVAAYLAAGYRARVSTINKDGSPHVVPISYTMLDGAVAFWAARDSHKAVNLRRDQRVACIVDDGLQFHELRGVELRGLAELFDDADTGSRLAELFLQKVPEEWQDTVRAQLIELAPERVVVTIKPERIASWDHTKVPGVRPQDIGA